MDRENIRAMKLRHRNLYIVFVGDPDRGKRLQEALKPYGYVIRIVTEMQSALDEYAASMPDLVILDDFPESNIARSVYYHLRSVKAGPFLALNDSPHALRFLHVDALSFIKIIDRDPEPEDLIRAIRDLVKSNQKLRSRHPETNCCGRITFRRKFVDFCHDQHEACCC